MEAYEYELLCAGHVQKVLPVATLPWESSQWKLPLSYLCAVTLERKLEVTVTAVSQPCSPGLGRETELTVTAKPA